MVQRAETPSPCQESIRGCDVFLIQPTSPPVNDNLMELLVMIDACRRASARSVTAVIPYFGYARADRKVQGRESIAAKLTANLLTEAGADRILAMDLHSSQCVGEQCPLLSIRFVVIVDVSCFLRPNLLLTSRPQPPSGFGLASEVFRLQDTSTSRSTTFTASPSSSNTWPPSAYTQVPRPLPQPLGISHKDPLISAPHGLHQGEASGRHNPNV